MKSEEGKERPSNNRLATLFLLVRQQFSSFNLSAPIYPEGPTVPVRPLLVRSMTPRKGISDSSVGIVPVKLFEPSTRRVRFVKLPMTAAGKEPEV